MKMDRRRFLVTTAATAATAVSLRTLAVRTQSFHGSHPHAAPRQARPHHPCKLRRPQLRDAAALRPHLLLLRQHRAHRSVPRSRTPRSPPHRRQHLRRRLVEANTHFKAASPPRKSRHAHPAAPRREDSVSGTCLRGHAASRHATSAPSSTPPAGRPLETGINGGSSTPERAAEEAEFVAKTLGPQKLEYFRLGNEPDIF